MTQSRNVKKVFIRKSIFHVYSVNFGYAGDTQALINQQITRRYTVDVHIVKLG